MESEERCEETVEGMLVGDPRGEGVRGCSL
jgi:hypothetical protein